MRRALVPCLAFASIAFGCVPDTAGPAPPKPPPATPVASASASASAAVHALTDASPPPRTLIPEGPAKWRSAPREQSGFYALVDGLCSELSARRVGNDVVVHYGGGSNPMYMDGKRRGPASFIALRESGLESIGAPPILSPTGIAGASLEDFWIADSTGSRSSEGAVLHRYTAGKWKTYGKDQTHLHAWVDGGIIGTLGMAVNHGDVWVEGSSVKPPAALDADLHYPALSAFPTGDVLVVGHSQDPPGGPYVARHWAPGKKLTTHNLDRVLPPTAENDYPWLYEVAPDEVYVIRDTQVARWDGAALRALGKSPSGEIFQVRRAAPDDLWVLTKGLKLQHLTAAGAVEIKTPEPAVDFDGIERGGLWVVGKSGKLYRREGEGWKEMPLPMPAFTAGTPMKAKAILVLGPDDVLLTGKYWEKGPFWKDQELHTALFRSRPVKETLRCNEPDPENNNINLGSGFQSWPPMATADCTSPFAVLARRSNAVPKDDDWPRIRAALKGHPELGEVVLVDFVSGDRKFVGAKGKDLETAKKLASIVAKGDRLRPEVVCGSPEPTRSLAIDLATGNATVK